MRRFEVERVALVTGAGRGLGLAVARKLAEAGARVVAADIESAAAREAADRLLAPWGPALGVPVDVADPASVEAMVEEGVAAFGRVDILVNNAGILYRTRFPDISPSEWERVLRVNLTGPFLCTRAVLPRMKEQRYGRIVNISSSAGRSVSTLGGAHYTASKAGLLGLTRAVAKEAAPFGITVNAVCPGLFDTEMVRSTTSPEERERLVGSFPVPRMGIPEEVGEAVLFLCSEEAAYITGAALDINGGDLMI